MTEAAGKKKFLLWNPVVIVIQVVVYAILFYFDEPILPVARDITDLFQKLHLNSFSREMGSLMATLLAAILIWKLAPKRRAWIPILVISTLFAGAVSETIKPTAGRMRPNHSDGRTVFMERFQRLSYSLPSGHATIAAANAHVLATALPPARPVMYGLAFFCGAERVEKKRHFVSDVFLGWLIGLHCSHLVIVIARRKKKIE